MRGEVADPEVQLREARHEIERLRRQLAGNGVPSKLQGPAAEDEQDGGEQRRRRLNVANVQRAGEGTTTPLPSTASPPIAREFKKLEPWITKFVIEGVAYGGDDFDPADDVRIDQFFDFFPEPKRILELGSFEGGHTLRLAAHPSVEQVVAIEGRQLNVERGKLVQRLLEVENVDFVQANLEATDLTSFGDFDVIFCSGLLYHLPRPWELVKQLRRVSGDVFVWTHYVKEAAANTRESGYEGRYYDAPGLSHPLCGMSPASFWPTLDSLHRMLSDHGYENLHVIQDDPDHMDGPAVTLAATVR